MLAVSDGRSLAFRYLPRYREQWAVPSPSTGSSGEAPQTSIISIDSFRALDIARIFALNTTRSFDGETPLLVLFPRQHVLNRIMGGRDVVRLAALLGVDKVIKRREFSALSSATDPGATDPGLGSEPRHPV